MTTTIPTALLDLKPGDRIVGPDGAYPDGGDGYRTFDDKDSIVHVEAAA